MRKYIIGAVVFVLLVAVVFLILAPCLGYANIIEMFRAWVGNKPQTPIEDVVETAKIIFNSLRI